MTRWLLTQAEADTLLAMPKKALYDDVCEYPQPGGKVSVPLVSHDGREEFLLDITCGRIDLAKVTYQNRARKVIVLARLDINGRPHTNPDGEVLGGTHLHMYREGFEDKWAIIVPRDHFARVDDPAAALDDFLRFCHVDCGPTITTRLAV